MSKNNTQYPKCTLLTVQCLSDAIKGGASIAKACRIAGIGRSTYYYWRDNRITFMDSFVKKKPDGTTEIIGIERSFKEEMELAQEFPNAIAKRTVIQAIINGDVKTALERLKYTDPEFKRKYEFGDKTEDSDPNPLKNRLKTLEMKNKSRKCENSSQKKKSKK